MLTVAIAQLSRWVNPMNIAQRSWVRHWLPFSCHWAQYFFATWNCFVPWESAHHLELSLRMSPHKLYPTI